MSTTPESIVGQSQAKNMYSQLEAMMAAVRKEAMTLEVMKQKVKEMDELKTKVPELKERLATSEARSLEYQTALREAELLHNQMRSDMQKLNDLYTEERREHLEAKQISVNLEAEVARSRQEFSFFQREAQKESAKVADARKKAIILTQQLSEAQAAIHEGVQAKGLLEKKLEESENDRASSSSRFWMLSEEIGTLKKEAFKKNEEVLELNRLLHLAEHQALLEGERRAMMAEDMIGRVFRDNGQDSSSALRKIEISALRTEIANMRGILLHKDEALKIVQANIEKMELGIATERIEFKAKLANELKRNADLISAGQKADRNVEDAQHRVNMLTGEIGHYKSELEKMQSDLASAEAVRIQRDAEFVREMKNLAAQKDGAHSKSMTMTNQVETLQIQIRELQNKHWAELQRAKEAESKFSDEVDLLQDELQEKNVKIATTEAEKQKMEDFMRAEMSAASQMTVALRGELEKRLDELTQTRRERDSLRDDKAGLVDKIAELETNFKKVEESFRAAMEADRAKLQQDVRSKLNRLKSLENEKQELLRETNELINQVTEGQRELTSARHEAHDSKLHIVELESQIEVLKGSKIALEKKLKSSQDIELEMREQMKTLETNFRSDVMRLDALVKDSKKSAAQQVIELSTKVHELTEHIKCLEQQKSDVEKHKERITVEAEKVREQLENATRAHEDMQQQMLKDVTALKKENNELRSRAKLMTEGKNKTDMDMMSMRLELTSAENEVARMAEWCKDVELKIQVAEEERKMSKAEIEEAVAETRKTRAKLVDVEEVLAKKTTSLEQHSKELGRLEREGLAEARRLRLQLAAAEREVNEMKAQMEQMTKEVADGKASFLRLQQSTNSSVSGLLDELKATEDALSHERKRSQLEAETFHTKVAELQANLEKARETFIEQSSKSKADKSDKEMRILFLEGEVERLRGSIGGKEQRIEELEKQRQCDRAKLIELRELSNKNERECFDAKANLELEQTQRKRLETRIRHLDEEMSKTTNLNSLSISNAKFTSKIGSAHGQETLHNSIDAAEVYDVSLQQETKNDFESLSCLDLDQGGSGAHADSSVNIGTKGSVRMTQSPSANGTSDRSFGFDYDVNCGHSAPHQSSHSSPVDRVSAALAARAAAESSKISLQRIQQQRLLDRQTQAFAQLYTQRTASPAPGNQIDSNGVVRASSRRGEPGLVDEVREAIVKATSVVDNDMNGMAQSKSLLGGDDINDAGEDADGLEKQGPSVNSSPDKKADRINELDISVEASIERTQMFLQQRLAAKLGEVKYSGSNGMKSHHSPHLTLPETSLGDSDCSGVPKYAALRTTSVVFVRQKSERLQTNDTMESNKVLNSSRSDPSNNVRELSMARLNDANDVTLTTPNARSLPPPTNTHHGDEDDEGTEEVEYDEETNEFIAGAVTSGQGTSTAGLMGKAKRRTKKATKRAPCTAIDGIARPSSQPKDTSFLPKITAATKSQGKFSSLRK